jgi:hypothetical protein
LEAEYPAPVSHKHMEDRLPKTTPVILCV